MNMYMTGTDEVTEPIEPTTEGEIEDTGVMSDADVDDDDLDDEDEVEPSDLKESEPSDKSER